jgi:hypothetical protein
VQTGIYNVSVPGFNGRSGTVQVTVYEGSNYCIATIPPSVVCYDANGNPANTKFALLYETRFGSAGNTNHAIAFVYGGATPVFTGQIYNSTGGANKIMRKGTGLYTALLPGLLNSGGQVQITPYINAGIGPLPARCNASDWQASSSGTSVDIACVDKSGAAADNIFMLAYSYGLPLGAYGQGGPHLGAYTFANQPTQTRRYYAGDHYQYNNFGTGPLAIQRTGTGTYTVTVPGKLTYSSSIALVSAVGPAGTWCNVASLVGATINVACYAQGGVPVDSRFTVTFQTSS